MAWQDGIVRWRWSRGWLPQGFTRAFGRLWWSLLDISPGLREKAVCDWLNACHLNEAKVKAPPKIVSKEIIYPEIPEVIITGLPDPLVEFDEELKKKVKSMKFSAHLSQSGNSIRRLPAWKRSDCRICPYYFKYTGILCEGCV